jgi:hypothetical protein
MSSIIFGEIIDIAAFGATAHGATSGYVVAYDIDGVLKQKDIITGSVSIVGSSAAGGSLSNALLIGNQTGITPIIVSTSSYIISGNGGNKIDLNSGIITSGTSSNYSYLIISGDNVVLGNGGLGNSRVLIGTSSITTEYNTNNSQVIGTSSYVLKLSGQNVLVFNTGTVSTTGATISSILSSKNSSIAPNVINSVVIGGEAIVATQSNYVYVPNVYLQDGKVIRGTGIGQLKFTATQSIVNFGDNNVSVSNNSVNLGGTVSVNDLYKLPTTDGTVNQIIKTDGAGNLTWTNNASNLAYTVLPTTYIQPTSIIYNNDGVTTFGPYSIDGVTVGSSTSSNNFTVPKGSKVSYSGVATIVSSGVVPTSITGNFIFSPNLPVSYPAYGTTSSLLTSTTTLSVILSKPRSGLIYQSGFDQVIAAVGNDTLVINSIVTFSDLFYFGTLSIGTTGLPINQTQVDSVTASQIQGLGNYKFGTKAQSFTIADSLSNRVAFAYPSSYGDINTLTYTGSILNTISGFKRATSDISIVTLSGITVSYRLYVANADNSWNTTITTT